MKKLIKRNGLLAVLFFVCATVLLASCSKDDEAPEGGSIDAAIGTYVGKLKVMGGGEYFNAVINVTKVDASHVKIEAKSEEDYSGVAPKTMKVSNTNNMVIGTLLEPNGSFTYSVEDKSVLITTEQTQKEEMTYIFEGKKQ